MSSQINQSNHQTLLLNSEAPEFYNLEFQQDDIVIFTESFHIFANSLFLGRNFSSNIKSFLRSRIPAFWVSARLPGLLYLHDRQQPIVVFTGAEKPGEAAHHDLLALERLNVLYQR